MAMTKEQFGRSPTLTAAYGTWENYLKSQGQSAVARGVELTRTMPEAAYTRQHQEPEPTRPLAAPLTKETFGKSPTLTSSYGTWERYASGPSTPRTLVSEQEFGRSSAMGAKYGSYENYRKGLTADGKYYSLPADLFAGVQRKQTIAQAYASEAKQRGDELSAASKTYQQRVQEANGKLTEAERLYSAYQAGLGIAYDACRSKLAEHEIAVQIAKEAQQNLLKAQNRYTSSTAQAQAAYADFESDYALSQERYDNWRGNIRDRAAIGQELEAQKQKVNALEGQRAAMGQYEAGIRLTSARDTETQRRYQTEAAMLDQQLAEEAERLRLLREEQEWAQEFYYAGKAAQPDFTRNIAYRPELAAGRFDAQGRKDELALVYAAIHGDKSAQNLYRHQTGRSWSLEQMREDEKNIFTYLYNTEGREAAQEYLDYLEKTLDRRLTEGQAQALAEFANKNALTKAVASAQSVLLSPLQSLSFIGQTVDMIHDGEINEYAPYNAPIHWKRALRGAVDADIQESLGEHWGKWGSFGYETAMSMLDFGLNLLIANGFGAATASTLGAAGAEAAAKQASQLVLGIMGTGAAADKTIEAKERGLSDAQAYALGLAAGAAEIVSEVYSVETLLEGIGEKGFWGYFLKNTLAEGAEEGASDVMNTVADVLIAGDKSEWRQAMAQYMAQGKTETQAFGMVFADQAAATRLDMLGGAISGGTMTGIEGLHSKTASRRIEKRAEPWGRAILQSDEATDAVLAEGLAMAQGTPAHTLAQQLQTLREKNKTIDAGKMGLLTWMLAEAEKEGTGHLPDRAEAMQKTQETAQAEPIIRQPDAPGELTLPQPGEVLPGGEVTLEDTARACQIKPEVVQRVRRIAQAVGREVRFYDSPVQGENGKHRDGSGILWINARSQNPVAQIISHELTHSIEQWEHYAEFSQSILRRMERNGADLAKLRQEKTEAYNAALAEKYRAQNPGATEDEVARRAETLAPEDADKEIVAEFVERNLLTNEAEIRAMVGQDRSLGQRILAAIRRLLAKLGSDSNTVWLQQVYDSYARALKEAPVRYDLPGDAQTKTDLQEEGRGGDAENAGGYLDELTEQLRRGEITEEEFDQRMEEFDKGGTEDLIERSMGMVQYSIDADSAIVEENISSGNRAIQMLLDEAQTRGGENLRVENAMYRSGIGHIDIIWGRPGVGKKLKHGEGLAHIIAKRNAENGNGIETVFKLVEVIAKATEVEIQRADRADEDNYRIKLHYDGYTAILAKKPKSNHWLLSGWEDYKETATYATGEVRDSSGATATAPMLTRRNGGNAAVSENGIAQNGQDVKQKYSFGETSEENALSDAQRRENNQAAIAHFGRTYRWSETGYLLLDGTKLDFSGKRYGAPGGYRTVDHREITNAIDYGDNDYGYSDGMVQFMQEGNIRIMPECGGINLSVMPTKEQLTALEDFVSRNRGEVILDIDSPNGDTIYSVEYPKGTYAKKVTEDIRNYFKDGTEPHVSELAKFRWSISEISGEKGEYGMGVILDTNLFEGVKPRYWGKVLGKFVYEHLAGRVLTIYDENGNAETVHLARTSDRVRKDGANSSHRVLDKLARYNGNNVLALATVQIDEVLAASRYEGANEENSHQWMDRNGWEYRKTYLQVKNGNIYEATLNIANGDAGRIIYAISKPHQIDNKKSTPGGVVPSTENGRGSLTSRGAGDSVSQDSENVKQKFSFSGTSEEKQEMLGKLRQYMNGQMSTQDIRQYIANRQNDPDEGKLNLKTYAQVEAERVVDQAHREGLSAEEYIRQNWELFDHDGTMNETAREAVRLEERMRKKVRWSFSGGEETQQRLLARDIWLNSAQAKAANAMKRAERGISARIAEIFSVPKQEQKNFLMRAVQELTGEFIQSGKISNETFEELVDEAYARGRVVDEEYYNTYKSLKRKIRLTKLSIADADGGWIADYNQWRKRAWGVVTISPDGLPVDSFYHELNMEHPGLFPQTIANPTDQLEKIVEVARSIKKVEHTLDQYYGKDAAEFKEHATGEMGELFSVIHQAYAAATRAQAEQVERTLNDAETLVRKKEELEAAQKEAIQQAQAQQLAQQDQQRALGQKQAELTEADELAGGSLSAKGFLDAIMENFERNAKRDGSAAAQSRELADEIAEVEQQRQEDIDLFWDSVRKLSVVQDEPTNVEEKVSTIAQAQRNGFAKSAANAWSYLRRKMEDSGEAVGRVAKAVQDRNLYPYYNMARASSSAAVNMIVAERSNIRGEITGKGLNQIFDPIRAEGEEYYKRFQVYLFHRHNIDRMSRFSQTTIDVAQAQMDEFKLTNPELNRYTEAQIERMAKDETHPLYLEACEYIEVRDRLNKAERTRNLPVFGYDVTAEESGKAVQALEAQNKEFVELAREVYAYIDNLMQYRVDSGLITQAECDELKKIYPCYVPTFRSFEKELRRGSRRDSVQIGSTVQQASGGTQKLMPIHKALAQQTLSVVREGSKNRFGLRLLNARQNGKEREHIGNITEYNGNFSVDTFDQPEDESFKRKNSFIVRENGKMWQIEVSPALFEAVEALSPSVGEQNIVTQTIRKGNDAFKALCTGKNPTFLIRNLLRDFQDALLYSQDTSEFLKQYPQAIKEIAAGGRYWKQYQALGGVYSSIFDYSTGNLKTGVVKKKRDGTLAYNPKGRMLPWDHLTDKIEMLNMAVEQAPRLAEFMATVKKAERMQGTATMDDLMQAMHNAADVTVNFGRSGTLGKKLNANFVPFLNPSIQGYSKMIRMATERKSARAWAMLALKCALFGIAPRIINEALGHGEPDWEDLKERDKDIYFLFKIGDGLWLKLPKGRTLSVFGIVADRAWDMAHGEQIDLKETVSTIGSQTAPANPFENNILAAWQDADLFDEKNAGETWYGSRIESQRLQNYAPEDRYDAKTDVISRWLGKTFKLSPKKINYLLDQYSGVIGDFLLPMLTPTAEQGMFASAFTVDSVFSNRYSQEFYGKLDELTYQKNRVSASGMDSVVYKFLNRRSSEISEINKAIREIEENPDLSNKEKRELLRVQYTVRNGIMKDALAKLDSYAAAAKKYYERSSAADEADRIDEAYRNANREIMGAEYALQVYNKSTYEKAQELHAQGVDYDTFFDFYFEQKEIDAAGREGAEQKLQIIDAMELDDTQKMALYGGYVSRSQAEKFKEAGMEEDKAYQTAIAIDEIGEGASSTEKFMAIACMPFEEWVKAQALEAVMSESAFQKYRTAVNAGISTYQYCKFLEDIEQYEGKGRQAEVWAYIDALPLTTEQKDALHLAIYKESTLSKAPWH